MYDIAKGRPARIDVEWNPFQRLDTVFRAGRAARLGAVAGGILGGAHLYTALIVAHRVPAFYVLAGSDPRMLSLVQSVMGLVAIALALAMRSRPSVWVAGILLAWGLGELAWPLTIHLYAHATPTPIAVLILIFALLGLRGALALKRAPSDD